MPSRKNESMWSKKNVLATLGFIAAGALCILIIIAMQDVHVDKKPSGHTTTVLTERK